MEIDAYTLLAYAIIWTVFYFFFVTLYRRIIQKALDDLDTIRR
jgi:hypothetical protein